MPDTAAEKARWSAQNRDLEADLRSDLCQVLIPFALNEVGIPQAAIRQEGSGLAGRYDSMFGSAIVEYKAPRLSRDRRERERAAEQALGYLDDRTLGALVVIVTDGETWGVLRDVHVLADIGEQATLDFGDDSLALIPPIARFAWRDTTDETSQAVLDLLGRIVLLRERPSGCTVVHPPPQGRRIVGHRSPPGLSSRVWPPMGRRIVVG